VRRIARGGALLIALGAAFVVPGAAFADTPPPDCGGIDENDRPAMTRAHELTCQDTQSVAVASAPDWLAITDLRLANGTLTWRGRPSDDAPAQGELVFRLTGAGGSADKHVGVYVTPMSHNTPPNCNAMQFAQRSSGTAPVTFQFDLACFDNEGDPLTLGHSGPGRFVVTDRFGDTERVEYTTAATNGPESATYWATDDLGARSASAGLSFLVGPSVDHPTECVAADVPFDLNDPMVTTLYARPGVVRHFGVMCWDDDGDSFDVAADQPSHGSVSRVSYVRDLLRLDSPPGRPVYISRLYDTAYTPAGPSTEQDELVVRATRPGVPAHLSTIDIVPRSLPANEPARCAGDAEGVEPGATITVQIPCDDGDGDPLTAEVANPPSHGALGAPAVEPTPGGGAFVAVSYGAPSDFTGSDSFDLRVGDGNGEPSLAHVDIDVRVQPPFTLNPPAGLPRLRPQGEQPATGQPPAASPVQQARRALRTHSVRLVRHVGDARVFAARRVVRRGLRPRPAARALAVSCDLPCRLSARVRAGRHASYRHASVRPGRAAVLRLKRGDAARLARAHRARFALGVAARGRTRHATIVLRAPR
jgi:hypothetical protein